MLDLIIIGHFVLDFIISSRIPYPTVTLGGPATFTSLAARKLGVKVGVVSKVGKDFHKYFTWLLRNNVDLSHTQIVENALTTHLVLTYSDGERKLQLKSKAPNILPKDISTSLHAKAIHIAPVANELSVEIVRRLRNSTPLLSIDLQGFLREFDEKGAMKLRRLDDINFLQCCDVFKSSIQEIKMVTGYTRLEASIKKIRKCGVKIIFVTMGRKGIMVYLDEDFYHIPACKPEILKDSTGAGDVFIGAFLSEYIRDKEPLWCCCVGSAAASFVVEGIGSQRFGEKNEVYERATEIYENGIKPLPHDAIV